MVSSVMFLRGLAVVGIILLWGVSTANGTVWQLLRAVWTAKLDDVPFHISYTGVPLIDYPIALLVAFFHSGTNGTNVEYQVFLFNAYCNLQPAFMWLYVERSRSRGKDGLWSRPLFVGLLWQCLGAAIALPFCYAEHLAFGSGYDDSGFVDEHSNLALPIAYLAGAVLPVFVGMRPLWQTAGTRTPRAHQTILAAWQIDPVYVSVLLWSLGQLSRAAAVPCTRRRRSSYHWARISHIIAALTGFGGHIYACAYIFTAENPSKTFSTMFVPTSILGEARNGSMLVTGPWLFLQYDFWIFSLANVYWVFCLLSRLERRMRCSQWLLAGLLLVGSAVIGPATTASLGLFWRESCLHSRGDMLESVTRMPSEKRKTNTGDALKLANAH